MSKEMIISVNGREKKIAIVEDDVVTEFYVERGDENQGIVGNIYKGRVMKVLPGMQSAFVDIGLERDSFLYVSDFFDEEEEDVEVEEKREIQRQVQKQPRSHREGLRIAPLPEQEPEEDKELELRMAALRHIEEIAEEPALEAAPDEEKLEAGLAEAADETGAEAPLNPRQRRQRRLRYADQEPKAEKAPAKGKAQSVEAKAGAEGQAAETEDEYSGRRRRRPRRRRGAETPEVVEVSDELTTEGEEERPSYIIVHHEPLERITDDDTAEVEGEMLKDAMLQERITERIHEEERRTSLLEVEPTPEVLVGSLHRSISTIPGFERVSDDSEARPDAEMDAETDDEPYAEVDIEAGKIQPISEWTPGVYETFIESYPETPEETESGFTRSDFARPDFARRDFARRDFAPEDETEPPAVEPAVEFNEDDRRRHVDAPQNELSAASPLETAAEAPEENREEDRGVMDELRDAIARIRQRPRRGEMATRRGGRGRRRTTYRSRATAATEPSVSVEERRDEETYDQAEQAPPPALSRPAPALSRPAPALSRPADRFARPVITDLLREGQEIIVQIAKEPIGQKGARITSHVALPGRYIVYMPTVEHIGVSRKIGTDEERQRLKRTLHQLRAESAAAGGFIVRTAANGCSLEELREDMQYLIRTWTDIRRRADCVKAPAIAHRDLDLVQRILRDQLSSDFSAIRVDSEFEYERIVDFVNRFAPKLVNRVKLYTKDTPILEHYGVQQEIDKAVKPRVWLKSGGYIVINQTEALVAIDVNTGKFVGKSNRLEDTIVKTNLEAAKEIVRQIRLRDLGGIIVLDFIDMEERKNRQKVMTALEQELRSDRSPSKILQFNDFGLVAITRKRVKQSLERTLCTPCAYCGGGGMVKSPQTVSYEILAEARRISKDVDHHNEVILRVNPDVAKALRGQERDVLAEIEAYLGGLVTIKSDPTVHQEQFDIALA
ncbi:MAG: Rne/Rng family ribonuclease [Acidobacteria bacterium]|nr:Rne/Rng family ribonuclease [Acidobacteriota bacterium]